MSAVPVDAVTFVALALAGGLGAVCRLLLDAVVTARFARSGERAWWGTALVNLSGSLLLGLVTGIGVGHAALAVQAILGTGFLGGYTTFSTASLQTVRLLGEGDRGRASLQSLGLLVATTALAALGLWIGSGPA